MLRVLAAAVLVHCALWVWASDPPPMQLDKDISDVCALTAGDPLFADYSILKKARVKGRRHSWSRKIKFKDFLKSPSNADSPSIKYIEILDQECKKSGGDPGTFATISEMGKGQKWVVIKFDLGPRKDYDFRVFIRG